MADRRAVFAIPGDLGSPTGGYAYARRMLVELRAKGWAVSHLPLGPGFPDIDPACARAAYAALGGVASGVPVIVDGLALGVLPEAGRVLRGRAPLVAMVHHPLALESGLSAWRTNELRESEREALSGAVVVVASSRTTAATLQADYAVPAERIVVAVPGTDEAPFAAGSGSSTVHLLSVGSLVPRKGHDILLRALAGCAGLSWRLTVVGDDTRDGQTSRALRALVCELGLASRVDFTGAIESARLEALYAAADLFVLASRHEGFGMAGTEAIARGLPVVSTTAGAIPEALPAPAAWLVAPEDVDALGEALRTLLGSPERLREQSRRAREAAGGLARWRDTATALEHALERAEASR